jgi:uncharacterized protein YbjQ (UPF0145 family)
LPGERSSFAEGDIIITTANDIPGRRVVKVLGVALGITVRSRGLGGNLLASLRSLVGGEIKEYTEMSEQARVQAIQRMVEHAKKLGANAVIAFRLDSNEIGETMDEIIAYGTAVLTAPSPEG